MRIAHLSTDPGIAFGGTKGASVHLQELAGAFADAGADVLVLVAACRRGEQRAGSVEVLPGPGQKASAAERVASDSALAAWLAGRLEDFGADLLYERFALHSAAGSLAARSVGIPHVVELNAPLLGEAEKYRSLDLRDAADELERSVLRDADLVLAVSSPLAHYAQERGARCVEVLPNAVAVERYQPRTRVGGSSPVAVFSGSLRPWHGIDSIAEAWGLLEGEAPSLLVIGDGPGRSALEAVGARVTGAVPHRRVPALLAGADIALAPYAKDAPDYFSPLKLFEYLAAGLATVVAALPGVCDVVTPETAVLVPRGDSRALAEAVAGLAGDPERRERLGHAGRALVAAEHTWAHRARTILDLGARLAPAEALA
jgi:glycosyltransferase involved in cell wall biosynthesis